MEQRHLGRSGLRISRLGLGTASWGRQVDQHEASEQIRAFLDAGGTLVDTADTYGHGESERVIGALLSEVVAREEIVLATKAGLVGPRTTDGSRRHLLRALDQSLQRLGTDHIDLWQLNRWDPHTPVEETLAACDVAVSTGRVRYVAVSNYAAWQTATAVAWQRAVSGRAPIVATQVEYSLLERGIEREVLPFAQEQGVGVLAWAPLGRGVLTGKYRGGGMPAESRAATAETEPYVRPYLYDEHSRVVNSVVTAAEGLDTTPLVVALAWVRDRPGVTAAIVGARTVGQLRVSLQAEEVTLPDEIRRALDDVSAPVLSYPEA